MNNKKIGILTDSAVDITNEIIEKNNIEIMPFTVMLGDKTYVSRKNISVQEMFDYADKNKVLAKTSQINPQEFINYFQGYLEKYEQIIYIGLSSKISGTFSNAILAAKEIDEEGNKIFLVDSMNLSSAIGLLVLKACKLRDEGKTATEIVEEVNRCVPLVRTQFSVNTLTYLHMGGRCSGTAKLFGTLLKIKPIIRVVDGQMIVAKKPVGNYTKALNVILDYVKDDIDNIDFDNIMITHCLANEDAIYLRDELNKIIPDMYKQNIHETFADVIVSTHCGPRTIGILYILKK